MNEQLQFGRLSHILMSSNRQEISLKDGYQFGSYGK